MKKSTKQSLLATLVFAVIVNLTIAEQEQGGLLAGIGMLALFLGWTYLLVEFPKREAKEEIRKLEEEARMRDWRAEQEEKLKRQEEEK